MILETKLDFRLHLKSVQNKVNKTIELLRKLQNILPKTLLLLSSNHLKSLISIMET